MVHRAELEGMNSENQRLRDMVDEVTNNYNNLQRHLVTFMTQQQQKVDNNEVEADVIRVSNLLDKIACEVQCLRSILILVTISVPVKEKLYFVIFQQQLQK